MPGVHTTTHAHMEFYRPYPAFAAMLDRAVNPHRQRLLVASIVALVVGLVITITSSNTAANIRASSAWDSADKDLVEAYNWAWVTAVVGGGVLLVSVLGFALFGVNAFYARKLHRFAPIAASTPTRTVV